MNDPYIESLKSEISAIRAELREHDSCAAEIEYGVQLVNELRAENERLTAALSTIVTASEKMADMSDPIDAAARLLADLGDNNE